MSAAKKAKRLRPGELDDLVLAYLAEYKGDGPLTATAVGKGIGHSAGAVANCLGRLAKDKKVRLRPRSDRAATKRTSGEVSDESTSTDAGTAERGAEGLRGGARCRAGCAPRVGELTEQLRGLEARREELPAEEPDEREPLTDGGRALLQAEVRQVIDGGDTPTRKALLASMVDEIRVVSRAEIYPSFSLPTVRPPSGSVPLRGFEPRFPD